MAAIPLAGALLLGSGVARAAECDQFISGRIADQIRGPIEATDCSYLGRAGVDKANHKLESVCYKSSGPTSSVEINASFSCSTSPAALIKFSTSDRVRATADIRGSDCQVLDVKVNTSGEISKVVLKAFDANGRVRTALQDALNKLCKR
ncbi:hypothetical protein DA075_02800 [Methylobacterium currus]|uniref:DUF3617 domain-containing protein n=1 Tax=Methylobacterium currus TaxID=2051553 RepID=A0A2R4WEL2_9HYPH|nr:hypothetical protein [Methylobacterium currus]AWB19993.1 hypothetical protein DA075_02800 [Methylobacterium currus]